METPSDRPRGMPESLHVTEPGGRSGTAPADRDCPSRSSLRMYRVQPMSSADRLLERLGLRGAPRILLVCLAAQALAFVSTLIEAALRHGHARLTLGLLGGTSLLLGAVLAANYAEATAFFSRGAAARGRRRAAFWAADTTEEPTPLLARVGAARLFGVAVATVGVVFIVVACLGGP